MQSLLLSIACKRVALQTLRLLSRNSNVLVVIRLVSHIVDMLVTKIVLMHRLLIKDGQLTN
jgi:hypothetical protein